MPRLTLSRNVIVAIVGVLAVTAAIEAWMGRLPLGPDGRFGWLEADIWSSSQSQRVLDPYSFTHVLHGFLFYGLLWLVARKAPVSTRLFAAVALEAAWEILENSPIVIDRYRAVTIAQGYIGDSILNSVSDIFMAAFGFLLAWRLRVGVIVTLFIVSELLMLALIRDNLTLNILMLIAPQESVRAWQMAGR
ncbi:MAG: DUF2585 family protein [Acidobacteria bacterium]|jgi:hypothetical protein|nr:DUF2585 family protein [Acidobacteriota bacterium]